MPPDRAAKDERSAERRRWSPKLSVSRRRPRRSSAKGAVGLDSTRVRVRELVCATTSSSGRTRGRVGALTWLAAAPGGVARPQARRRAIARRSEGKQGGRRGTWCFYLCATRRRRAEGGAVVQRSCGGVAAVPSSARRRSAGNGGLGVPLVVWAPRVGSRRLLGSRRDSSGGR